MLRRGCSSRCNPFSRAGWGAGTFNAKTLHPTVQVWAVSVEPSRRFRDVPRRDSKRRFDHVSLVFIEDLGEAAVRFYRFFDCRCGDSRTVRLLSENSGENCHADFGTRMHDCSTLDDVCELAHVAGPRMTLEKLHCTCGPRWRNKSGLPEIEKREVVH